MAASVPASEIGTAMLAISVARALCRKAKITSTTITTARPSSSSTCATEARMPCVRSLSTVSRTLSGRLCRSSGSWRRMASTVAITLAPGWRCTLSTMAGVSGSSISDVPGLWRASGVREALSFLIATQAPRRRFSAPSTTSATSFRRTGWPATKATISSRYSCAVSSWSLALMVYWRVGPSKLPLAELVLAALMALLTASSPRPMAASACRLACTRTAGR